MRQGDEIGTPTRPMPCNNSSPHVIASQVGTLQCSPKFLDELITTSMHRPNIRPQILVRRSAAGLGRPTTARVRPIRSYSLSQRECLDQWLEKPHERAPQGGRPRLVLLVQFLHVIGMHVIPGYGSTLFTRCQGSTGSDRGQEPWLQARA
jgi:hypothetical protein